MRIIKNEKVYNVLKQNYSDIILNFSGGERIMGGICDTAVAAGNFKTLVSC